MIRFPSAPRAVAAASVLVLATPLAILHAQGSKAPQPVKYVGKPTVPAITPGDAMSRLYKFADDSMGGRNTGEPGHVKGTDYIASELMRFGLMPMGDNGTFFQQLPVFQRGIDRAITISVDGTSLSGDSDYLIRDQGPGARSLDGVSVVYGGTLGDTSKMIAPAAVAGKLVVFMYKAPPGAPAAPNRGQVVQRYISAAGIAVAVLEAMPASQVAQMRGPGGIFFDAGDATPLPTYLYVSKATAKTLLGAEPDSLTRGAAGKVVKGTARFANVPASMPVRNVVAMVPGSDPKLKGQIVVMGAHSDHIGTSAPAFDHDSVAIGNRLFRQGGADEPPTQLTAAQWGTLSAKLDSVRKERPVRRDSIYNGADDDGSGSMGLLEIAESFGAMKVKPKRSVLLVWHVAEEEGLWGSQYFSDHPTVPRDSIVAQLNMDMIGRGTAADVPGKGGPGYLEVIGSRRLSTELGDLLEKTNTEGKFGFKFNYEYDANGHPQQYYCRSDHYMYARYGIPVAFVSSGGHADYHMVTDEPQYIDYDKLAHTASLMQSLAIKLGNLDHRIAVDKPKPDPKGQCVQ